MGLSRSFVFLVGITSFLTSRFPHEEMKSTKMTDCEQDGDGVSDEMRDAVIDLHRRINRAVRREMNYGELLGMNQNQVIAVAAAAATNFLAGSTCGESEQLADEMRGRLK